MSQAATSIIEARPLPPLEAPFGPREGEDRWRVLHTRSRQEKAVAELLEAAGVRFYLPLIDKVAYHGGRRRRVALPLFSSYVFLLGPLEAVYFAMESRRVVRAIDAPDQERLEHELAQIRLALQGGAELDPYPFLKRGRWARVSSGPFQGVEGLVEERLRDADRLILQVDTLGRATSLEIDCSLLEPLD